MAADKALLLVATGWLLHVACASGTSACSSSDACASPGTEADTANLLQLPSKSEAGKRGSLAQIHAHNGVHARSTQGIDITFEYWAADDVGFGPALRVVIPTTIVGTASSASSPRTYNFLLDTGSSSVAFCNGTTNGAGSYIPPAQPVPRSGSSGTMQCNLYGGNNHGYLAANFVGELFLGDHDVNFVYGVMLERKGEKGNACGIPSAASQSSGGSSRLDGIFGFAGEGLNKVCEGSYTSCPIEESGEMACSGSFEKLSNAFQLVLQQAVVPNVFAIEWLPPAPQVFGPGFSTLYEGVAARFRLSQLLSNVDFFVPAKMIFGGAFYHIVTYGIEAVLPGQSPQGPNTVPESSNIVDTGTPSIGLPQDVYESLDGFFADNQDGTASVFIYTQSETKGGGFIELPIPAALWRIGSLFSSSPGILGSPLWIWYDHVQFDIASSTYSFLPRSSLQSFQNNFLNAVDLVGGED